MRLLADAPVKWTNIKQRHHLYHQRSSTPLIVIVICVLTQRLSARHQTLTSLRAWFSVSAIYRRLRLALKASPCGLLKAALSKPPSRSAGPLPPIWSMYWPLRSQMTILHAMVLH